MRADTANENGLTAASDEIRVGPIRRLADALGTALVLAALGGVAYWGHASGWTFARGKSGGAETEAVAAESAPPDVQLIPAKPGGGELPLDGRNVRIEFASSSDVEAAGIGITPAWPTPMTEQVAASAEVQFDPTRVARLSPRAGGVTKRVFKVAGDAVRAGDLLALVDSTEVGKAKAEFQHALVQARLREKTRDDLVAAKTAKAPAELREAEAALKESAVRAVAAAQALTNLGLPVNADDYRGLSPAEAARRMRLLGAETETSVEPGNTNLLPLRSPFAGVVLTADVVAGEVVDAGKILFVVVDPSRVWVTLHVGPEDARRVAVGQKVMFRPDGSAREHPAAVVWIGATADETTRTLPVRAEAENAAGALRASALGRGRIILREDPNVLVVPHEAVHEFGGRSLVFVRDPDFLKPSGPKAFHARAVRTGGRDEKNTEIQAGLQAGEVVATKGSQLLFAEFARAAGR